MPNVINATSTGNGGLITQGDDSGILNIQTNETTAITVDASQNVGIGTTTIATIDSTGKTLEIYGGAGGGFVHMTNSTTGQTVSDGFIIGTSIGGSDALLVQRESANMIFRTADTERMRIDSSGNFLVNRTSSFTPNSADNTKGFGILADSGQTLVNATGSVNALIVNNTNTNNRLLSFRSANTEVGGVTITSSTATFNGTSDSRLKEDLGVSTDTSVIDNTIIHDFKWTRDGTQGKGVFAQEAYEVYPLAVSKGSDELNESGNLANPWQVNYSQYIPDLIVYCQQLKKTVDTQAKTINALTARIVALETA